MVESFSYCGVLVELAGIFGFSGAATADGPGLADVVELVDGFGFGEDVGVVG